MQGSAGTPCASPADVRLTSQDWPGASIPNSCAGLRPVGADGRPLNGDTRLAGLWLDTGHGRFGGTAGPASGRLLALRVRRKARPEADAEAFRPARFAP
ncbi:MAG: FAD-dependent oxidoreductase [Pseudomonadota bacterium]